MAHGLPARVGENVSDEWIWSCQGTFERASANTIYRGENGVLLECFKKIFEFVSIREFSFPQKSSHLVGHEKGENESSVKKNFYFCETQTIFRYPSTIQLGTFQLKWRGWNKKFLRTYLRDALHVVGIEKGQIIPFLGKKFIFVKYT